MKFYFLLCSVVLFSFSCTYSKYRFPYKVKAKTYVFENNFQIEVDSCELIGINIGYCIQQIDENGKHLENLFLLDSLNVFEIEKHSSSLIQDLDFTFNKMQINVDSIAVLIVYMDSIKEEKKHDVFDSRRFYINPSNYLEFKKEEEPVFNQDSYLFDGLIIYSKDKNYFFSNYILWY